MHHHGAFHETGSSFDWLFLCIPFVLLIIFYIVAVIYSNKKYRKWPAYCTLCWIAGVSGIALACIGPIAEKAHTSFQAHMFTHLLLGMLCPLLLVFASPMRLVLRTAPVKIARVITKFLKSRYVQWITHPILATVLNVGGLWVLYTTGLYAAMHSIFLLYVLVHLHVFLAGYVFTVSMIYIDPTPHRTSFYLRSTMLILAMAAHSILSKWIYAHPPAGVETMDAQVGGMFMYYGGDAIDLIIVIVLCSQYFRGRIGKEINTNINLKTSIK